MQLSLGSAERFEDVESDSALPVRSYAALSDLPETYTALFEKNATLSLFSSLPWFQNFCATALDPGDHIKIFAVEANDANHAPLAVLLARWRPSASVLRPRVLSSMTNYYSSFYTPLLSSSRDDSLCALRSLVKGISEDKPSWDAIDLKWLDYKALIFPQLQEAFRQAGMLVQTYFCAGNWYAPVEGMSFRDYFDSLRSSVRNIAKSKNKKIERSGRARVEIIVDTNGLEPALEAYKQIYAASWKVPEPYPHFIPELARICAQQGWLRLGVAYVDGEPAAAQIWIVNAGVASIYKIAYNQRFRDLSIGTYLTTRMMEYVLDVDHVRELDYLTGDDKYKQDWMSQRRERWGILAMDPRTVRGRMIIARHIGGRAVKRALGSIFRRG